MNFEDMPTDDIERLAFYQREREREQEQARNLREKARKGEPFTDQEEAQWAYNRFGGASSCGY
jgi:hypothetical protein